MRYALKKVVKIAAVVVGLFIAGVAFLSYKGLADIHWQEMQTQAQSYAINTSQQVMNVVNSTTQNFSNHPAMLHTQALPISAGFGFILGVAAGLRRG